MSVYQQRWRASGSDFSDREVTPRHGPLSRDLIFSYLCARYVVRLLITALGIGILLHMRKSHKSKYISHLLDWNHPLLCASYPLTNMNTKFALALSLLAGICALPAKADENQPQTQLPPAVTVPVVSAPDQIIYLSQLPTVNALTGIAAAQGLNVKQIVQTDREVSVSYQVANGQVRTISYQLLPNVSAPVQVQARAVEVVPAQTVVYAREPQPVYYYDPFWGSYWYPPVAVNLGFRWGWGFRGGYRGHWH